MKIFFAEKVGEIPRTIKRERTIDFMAVVFIHNAVKSFSYRAGFLVLLRSLKNYIDKWIYKIKNEKWL